MYYPRSLLNLYQGGQNIAAVHFQQCADFPPAVLHQLLNEKPRRDFSKVGKPYWVDTCRAVGVYEEGEALWLNTAVANAAAVAHRRSASHQANDR